ncbi:MAG: 2-phosphosulfolactate phosphatase [Bacteroidetes bacterium]|nr:2-phosphosulfolactate phosphatase [Bacteroidota bacterium]
MSDHTKQSVEVCFSPALYPNIITRGDFIVVVVDILRATTSMCAALQHGVKEIFPVGTLEEAIHWKKEGFYVAAERDGAILDFADFGNSPQDYTNGKAAGLTIVYSTTNGTHAISVAKNAPTLAIGAFVNITALTSWLIQENRKVVILCAGWKNMFAIEDAAFAGALTENLIQSESFTTACDSALAAMEIWNAAKQDPQKYLDKAMHRNRLRELKLDGMLDYAYSFDQTTVVPVLVDGKIVDINKQ